MSCLVIFVKVFGFYCEFNMYVGFLENIKKEDFKFEDGEVRDFLFLIFCYVFY